MTPSELKANVERSPDRFFFTRTTMKFFGDTMRNYGVRKATLQGKFVWELWRKSPVKHGLGDPAFFCQETFRQVFKPIK